MDKSNIFYKAEKKAKAKKRAIGGFITWFAFIFFFLFLDFTDGDPGIQWAFFPIFGWGLGVFFQGIKAFDYFGYGEKWEKEELRKEIEKRKRILEEFGQKTGKDEDIDELDLEELRELRQEYKDSDFV